MKAVQFQCAVKGLDVGNELAAKVQECLQVPATVICRPYEGFGVIVVNLASCHDEVQDAQAVRRAFSVAKEACGMTTSVFVQSVPVHTSTEYYQV
jgi:hypothetical protein